MMTFALASVVGSEVREGRAADVTTEALREALGVLNTVKRSKTLGGRAMNRVTNDIVSIRAEIASR